MISVSNFLLIMMLLSYSIPIIYVYSNYSCDENTSVSSVIGSEKCQISIFYGMIVMGMFTVLYELNRGCKLSLCFICMILLGIYGVILVKENQKVHYAYAFLVFVGILCFMGVQCKYKNCDFLKMSMYLQICLLVVLVESLRKNMDIFLCEVFLIVNFAVFYVYIHITY